MAGRPDVTSDLMRCVLLESAACSTGVSVGRSSTLLGLGGGEGPCGDALIVGSQCPSFSRL